MQKRPSIIGITLGDVNGIGPEIALQAAVQNPRPGVRLVLIGDQQIVERQARRLGVTSPAPWSPDQSPVPARAVSIWNPDPRVAPPLQPGRCTAAAGRAAYQWILSAIDAALGGALDAIVTAPISKEGWMKAGIAAPGHTELLAARTRVKRFDMMLLTDDFRVVLATRHLPIRDVADALTRKGITDTIGMTIDALQWLGVRKRRIAVCGLNPHAGDGGAIGDEERRIIAPAIKSAARRGVELTGPVPADTVFYQVRQGRYDAVVAMYHDQALAPFKMIAFEHGVNLTLGLPIIRTSPDHGTAYDLAGKGRANPSSMSAAIALAAKLAKRPNPWRKP